MPSVTWDEQGLKKAGGQVLTEGDGISFAGWTIRAKGAPITKDADMPAISEQVGGARHLPEQLYGDSYLKLYHEASGFQIGFEAVPALMQWHADDLPPLQVMHAKNWQRMRAKDMQANNVLILQYDWTFTTSYQGSYQLPSTASNAGLEWKETAKAMDKSPLLTRDPILFFADIPLYESELDDNGASQLSVKIRVMPTCWFVLLRFWLRVDKLMVRLRETRVLCNLADSSPQITRETLHSEGTFEELSASGAPAALAAYSDADTTARVLQAVAPVGCKLYRTEVRALEQPSL